MGFQVDRATHISVVLVKGGHHKGSQNRLRALGSSTHSPHFQRLLPNTAAPITRTLLSQSTHRLPFPAQAFLFPSQTPLTLCSRFLLLSHQQNLITSPFPSHSHSHHIFFSLTRQANSSVFFSFGLIHSNRPPNRAHHSNSRAPPSQTETQLSFSP
ncbi:hypothetical protein Peur_037847 [Populus x canadensis]